jgi:glycogen synthase
VGPRVLVLSWEFPPIVEGGLARHVRKLTEQLAAHGADVHVLTRGGDHAPAEEERHGVVVHRVREPSFPRDDLDAFLAWVAQLNADMLAAGAELLERYDFDLLHSHDWLVAAAAKRLA